MNPVEKTIRATTVVIPFFCAMFNGRREWRIAEGKL
jgi:hypothetical protein